MSTKSQVLAALLVAGGIVLLARQIRKSGEKMSQRKMRQAGSQSPLAIEQTAPTVKTSKTLYTPFLGSYVKEIYPISTEVQANPRKL